MNLRLTVLLVALAVAVGLVAYINPFEKTEEKAAKSPWFYQVDMDDINVIEVNHNGDQVKFVREGRFGWTFDDPSGIPPSHNRWGGITLIFSGPQTRRDLTQLTLKIENPADYGLDNPATIVNVGLTKDRRLEFRLGDKTTDGDHHYAEVVGFDELFLIAGSWGDVVSRLATEPPVPVWYVKHEPETIVELYIYDGDPTSEETHIIKFDNDDGQWTVQDFGEDLGALPVDPDRWARILPLLSGPTDVTAEVAVVDDQDWTPWGITDDSRAIEIRFGGLTNRGTKFIDGVLYRVGKKIPDKDGYFGQSDENFVRKPVLFLDAGWTDTLLGLFDDVPYASDAESQASTVAE